MVAGAAWAEVGSFELTDPRGRAPWTVRFTKKEKLSEGVTGLVQRTTFFVPKAWEGKFVRFEVPFPMVNLDAVLFLNGRRIGDILRPAGELDVSRHLKYGVTNDVALYCTFTGDGTDYGKCPLDYDLRRVYAFRLPTPRFLVADGPVISDVFANTSWREKRLRMEIEVKVDDKVKVRGEGEEWNCSVLVADLDGKVVKSVRSPVSRLKSLPTDDPQTARFAVDIPWSDPICWELGRPYLYTAKIALTHHRSPSPLTFASYSVRFGFREVWREGRELMMNGHKLHLRTHYAFGVNSKAGAMFMQDIGYNLATVNHCMTPEGNDNPATSQAFDEVGYGVFYSCGALPVLCGWDFRTDERRRAYVDRFAKHFHRRTRNHPSVLGCYVTQMIICDIAFGPEDIAQSDGKTDRHELVNYVCDYHRKFNPNILYYSHADGSCGDIASGNMYLNWTPLQERVEWLNQWAEKGTRPWHGAEFGQPYGGCWYAPGRLLVESEQLARYFGNAAFEEETMKYLEGARERGDTNPSWHGGRRGAAYGDHPLYWDLHRLWCWYTNSRWRGNGFNGGNNYFNLEDGYGTPPDGSGYGRYGAPSMEREAGRRPAWVNPNYDNFKLGNQEFLGYIGGRPHHTDMTHAYWAGEKIDKQAVMIWDGAGRKDVICRWTLKTRDMRRELASGEFAAALPQGEIVKVPFGPVAPAVTDVTRCALTLSFLEGLKFLWTDTMDIEIHPPHKPGLRTPGNRPVALFDTTGAGEKLLKELGLKYVKTDPSQVSNRFTRLVVGRGALGETDLSALAPLVTKGLRVLILPQKPQDWQALGFDVQDEMSREMWAYDQSRRAPFAALGADTLRYWRGTPKYGDRPTGSVMVQKGMRGPRGYRTHTIAGLCLRTPDRVGYLPLIAGEFDMNYCGLLRFSSGDGGVWYCTLDFDDRIGTCPAATATARAVFGDFLNGKTPKPSDATVAETLTLRAKRGFVTPEGRIYRAEPLAGLGGELFRWTCPVEAPRAADGSFTLRRDQFRSQIGTDRALATNLAPAWAQMHVNRLFARKATVDGVQPTDEAVRRALYQSVRQPFVPLPAVHVCGPFESNRDDSEYQMNMVWNKQVEEMTIAGDFNPNFEFDLPQGGTCNWRPQLSPDAGGKFWLGRMFPGVSFAVCYSIAKVTRRKAGPVKMRFGVDWSAKVWVNGVRVSPRDGSIYDEANPPKGWGAWGSGHAPVWNLTVDLKEGENTISFKTGAGRSDNRFFALIEDEASGAAAARVEDAALEKVGLYEDLVPDHDPNVFHYW